MKPTLAQHAKPAVVLALLAGMLLAAILVSPALGRATSGGTAAPASDERPGGAPGGAAAATSPGPAGSTALSASPIVLFGRMLSFSGDLGPEAAHQSVAVEGLDSRGAMVFTTHMTTDDLGRYRGHWRSTHLGRFSLRVTLADGRARARTTQAAAPAVVTVYRPSLATWYGPGSYGQRTACGVRLTRHTLGVAHRTLPCGSVVEIAFRGRRIAVPVIDRGPFTSANWDLTQATAHALGFDGRATVGALTLRRPAARRR